MAGVMMASDTSTRAREGRTGITRPVVFAGIVLGTALTVWLMTGGLRFRIPDIPSLIGDALGAVVLWLLFMAAASVLSELAVRHHRAALRHGWRLGRRYGGRSGAYLVRRGGAAWRRGAARSYPWRARFAGAMRDRWAARHGEPNSAVTGDLDDDDPGSPEPAARPEVCAACGNPGSGEFGPLVTFRGDLGDGPRSRLIHRAHFEDPATGFYGQPYQEGNEMENTTSRTPRERARDRARRAAATTAGAAGTAWRQLIGATADYEPEDDSALLDWMAGEAAGMASYAESITDVYDTAVSGVGLDPVPLAALHDYADAAAACAEAMAAARAKFADHYAQVREFAAAGGLLPHDGRWITGEGT